MQTTNTNLLYLFLIIIVLLLCLKSKNSNNTNNKSIVIEKSNNSDENKDEISNISFFNDQMIVNYANGNTFDAGKYHNIKSIKINETELSVLASKRVDLDTETESESFDRNFKISRNCIIS